MTGRNHIHEEGFPDHVHYSHTNYLSMVREHQQAAREQNWQRDYAATKARIKTLMDALATEYLVPWRGEYPISKEWWDRVEVAVNAIKESGDAN